MAEQLTSDPEALRLLFTDDIYLISNEMLELEPAPEVKEPAEVYRPKKELKFLGENARNVLILVNDPSNEVSSAIGTALLWKIVTAMKLSNSDCAVLNYASYEGTTFAELAEALKPQLLLSFGVTPETLALPAQQTEVISLQQGIKTIFSSSLPAVELNRPIKMALWKTLQELTLS
ncbi:hypothetical protein [Pedobacter sp.]|uniref:hypothetical protein n=1 Tax=Pedobacter sp. TaxID=1411316 RepID=UPI003D7F35BE